jgi:quercetin dioxygenase-like cupin family protein
MSEFTIPPKHVAFQAKKLFGEMGKILDGAIAYMDLSGGGPVKPHTHAHSHLFIVTKGAARIQSGDREIILKKDESLLVDGEIPHSVWNHSDGETVMIGISVI